MPTDHPIFELSDTIVDDVAATYPTLATYLGIKGHDHRWDDFSPAGHETGRRMLERHRNAINELPPARDEWERLAILVARDFVEEELDRYAADDHLRDLDSLASTAQDIRQVFDHMDTGSTEGWQAIATRLADLPEAMAGYRASLEAGRLKGLAVARRQVQRVIEQARTHAGDESAFVRLGHDARGAGLADDLVASVDAGVAAAQGAYAEFADYLEAVYLPHAEPKDAVGRERYLRSARRYLGMKLDPEATYAWGWTEVHRLRREMEVVADEISPGASIHEVLALLKSDPGRLVADRDAFVAFIDELTRRALDDLAGVHFDVPDQIRQVDVKLAPPGGPLGAYYVGPSEDFTRPGSVWWSLEGDGPFKTYDEVSTAYHEGFPGHHLQIGIQLSHADKLSRVHRVLTWKPGLGEGWALYSELVMDELGYLSNPDHRFGFLAGQILRACRVVIDIGSHLELPIPSDQPFHPGEDWTFDIGVEMLQEYATLDPAYAESEMTRYLGWPGQAIAYKVGEKAILDVRDELQGRQGAAFDVKAFHSRVLEIGPVGIDLFRTLILAD